MNMKNTLAVAMIAGLVAGSVAQADHHEAPAPAEAGKEGCGNHPADAQKEGDANAPKAKTAAAPGATKAKKNKK